MRKQRVITAVLIIPFLTLLIWFGVPWFSLLIAAVVLIGAFEFFHMSAEFNKRCPLTYFGLLWTLALALSPHYRSTNLVPVVMAVAVVISLIWLLFHSPQEKAFHNWAWMVAGVIYVGWMLSYWIDLHLEYGRSWVYLAMFTTFANDTGAFFIGTKWGKHKLASNISPGKTWEGAIGGLLSAVMASAAISSIPILFSSSPLEYWQVALLGCLVSFFAQLGDLVESLLKRNMGLKESGNLLPGHGGVLDRFDSLIFVGVVVYYYVLLNNGVGLL
jgi:phosphatidate cytidylyltransferase